MGVEIEVGGVYVNETGIFSREILEIPGKEVVYRDFMADTGKPLSPWRRCSKATFRNWAARRCTPEESGRLDRDSRPTEECQTFEFLGGLVEAILKGIPDADLMAEVRRRNLISE